MPSRTPIDWVHLMENSFRALRLDRKMETSWSAATAGGR